MRRNIECIDWPDPGKGYRPEFFQVQDQTFEGKRIAVDNHQYGRCRFFNCTFVYSCGPFGFSECEVEGDLYLALAGSAERSLQFWTQFQEHIRRMTPFG
jgi:hypothetical protein